MPISLSPHPLANQSSSLSLKSCSKLLCFLMTVGRVSLAHPPSPAPEVEDLECTDAQPLMLQDEDMGGPPQHVSDDDETQVPTAAVFCSVQTGKKGQG